MYLGLLVEDVDRTLARLSLLRHMRSQDQANTDANAALCDAYAHARSNARAESYVTETLLSVGSRRMGSCLRGEPWCDEFTGSLDVKARWAAFREQHAA